jgi:MerR family transcriptional regulator, redox-sensitive transcriptional activator SoxR
MIELSIGQVAERAGLRTSTIRYYESVNVLPAPRRRGGQRRYDPAVLERLAFIQTAQRLGFSLAEIELLFRQPAEETPLSDRWQTLASQKLAEIDGMIRQAASIRRLLTRGLRCGCSDLHECIGCVLTNCREAEAE